MDLALSQLTLQIFIHPASYSVVSYELVWKCCFNFGIQIGGNSSNERFEVSELTEVVVPFATAVHLLERSDNPLSCVQNFHSCRKLAYPFYAHIYIAKGGAMTLVQHNFSLTTSSFPVPSHILLSQLNRIYLSNTGSQDVLLTSWQKRRLRLIYFLMLSTTRLRNRSLPSSMPRIVMSPPPM